MKKLFKLSMVTLFAAVGAFAFSMLVSPGTATAHEGDDHTEAVAQADTDQQQTEEQTASPYRFTAQRGDSYTKIARKSVQIYGITNNVDLSQAQIVAAETFLTSEAGFPSIDAGEAVELSADAVKSAVEKAQGLDDAAKALWEKYVPFVDFDTNSVGEARD